MSEKHEEILKKLWLDMLNYGAYACSISDKGEINYVPISDWPLIEEPK